MLPSCAFARGAAANNSAAATIAANVLVLSHVLAHCFMLASPFSCMPLSQLVFCTGSLRRTFGEGLKLRPIIISSAPDSNPQPAFWVLYSFVTLACPRRASRRRSSLRHCRGRLPRRALSLWAAFCLPAVAGGGLFS